MLEIEGLDHVVLRVTHMKRCLQFYAGLLGCREERRVDSLGLVQLRAGNSLIDLLPRKTGEPIDGQNMDHLCLRLRRFDGQELIDYFKSHGVEVGEPARRYGADGLGPSLYIKDPEGNTVELKGPSID